MTENNSHKEHNGLVNLKAITTGLLGRVGLASCEKHAAFAPGRKVWVVENVRVVLHRLMCVCVLNDNLINKNYCHGITFFESLLSSSSRV